MMAEDGWKSLTPQEFIKRIRPQPLVDHPLEHKLTELQSFGLADNLRRQLAFLGPRGHVMEVEVLGYRRNAGDNFPKTRAAHGLQDEDVVRLCAEADEWGLTQGIYLLHARLKEGVETRHASPGTWFDIPKAGGTSDSDVDARLVLAIDFDVDRPTGTSATDEELKRSIHLALSAWKYLEGALGGSDCMAYLHSGNGRQIHLALDSLPNDEANKMLAAGVLVGFDTLLSTPQVKIDKKLFDAKRILPACGTVKKKGSAGVESRPHRRTAIVTPATVRRLSSEDLRQLARKIWNDTNDAGRAAMNEAFGIREKVSPISPPSDSPFGAANAVSPEDVAQWLNLYDGQDVRCPGCGETSGVAVLQYGLKCHHNRCSSKGRNGFRTNVDLVAEVRNVSPRDAVLLLADRFVFDTSGLGSYTAPETPPSEPAGPTFTKPDRIQWISTLDIFQRLPPTKWLVPSLHLVAGRPTLLAGYGFSGKTLMVQSLALALASETHVWGKFSPNGSTEVRHFDYEQGKHATLKRYQRLTIGHGIDPRKLGDRLKVAIFPDVYLDDKDATDVYARACEGVGVVVLDALRGATPTLDENDSTIRRCIDNLSRVSEKTGAAFLILHHSGKVARDDPRAAPRGSSAIFDACGCVFVVSGGQNEPKEVQQTKAPAEAEGGSLETFFLTIEDVATAPERPTAGVRVVCKDAAEARAQSGPSAELDALKRSILEAVASSPGLQSMNSIGARVRGGRKDFKNTAIKELIAEGRLALQNGSFAVVGGGPGTGPGGPGTDDRGGPAVPPFRGTGDNRDRPGSNTSGPAVTTGGKESSTAKTSKGPGDQGESDRRVQAQSDADQLEAVPVKERSQWCSAQGWSDSRSKRARGALALRESAAARDAAELEKMSELGIDPAARAVELGWDDARVRGALKKASLRKESPSAPPREGTSQEMLDALVQVVAGYPNIVKATLAEAMAKRFVGVDIDALVDEAIETRKIRAVGQNGMRTFVVEPT
jgi:hypothetical protein